MDNKTTADIRTAIQKGFNRLQKESKKGKNTSPLFRNSKEIGKYLDSLSKQE